MSEMYRELMLEHYNNPENYGVLENAPVDIVLDNPTCGDHVHLTARLDVEGRIIEAQFEGHGCVVSMAAASMLTSDVVGKTPEQIAAMTLADVEALLGGVRLSMGRVKCATLALNALKKGLVEKTE